MGKSDIALAESHKGALESSETGGDDRPARELSPDETVASTPLAKAGAVSALALAVAACGGGSSGSGGGNTGGSSGGPLPTPTPTALAPQSDEAAASFILRASLSVSTPDIASIRSVGYEPWLNSQIAQPIDQTGRAFLKAEGFETIDANRWFNRDIPGDYALWRQLMTGSGTVRKRAALALSEFFVISLNTLAMPWRGSAATDWWDMLNRHAFGNFRDLLEAVTLHPAMGVYLNTRGNQKEDPATGRVPDENYGREVMQLFTIGLFELNLDGTVRTASNGDPLETYDNDDVTEISKAFTGYDFDYTGISLTPEPGNEGNRVVDPDYVSLPMTANPARWRIARTQSLHSTSEKRFLGTVIPAGTGAAETLRRTLDTLFNHPNVGPFFGAQMIQRLVTSNPSPAYVRRVAQVFNNNGSGVRGDLRAVFKAILMDDEALNGAAREPTTFGKLREPMLRFAQWGRTFDARSADGQWRFGNLSNSSNTLGQAPLRPPSVFNFFRPAYSRLNSQSSRARLLAPEFQLVNETSVAGYVNFMERSIDGRGFWMRQVAASYANEIPLADRTEALLDRLSLLLTAGQMTAATRATIAAALSATSVTASSSNADKLAQVQRAVMLVMSSNDYMVQK